MLVCMSANNFYNLFGCKQLKTLYMIDNENKLKFKCVIKIREEKTNEK